MRRIRPNRKARFKAALALADITMSDWAKKMKRTRQHVGMVLREERASPPLVAEIDAFIAEVEEKVA